MLHISNPLYQSLRQHGEETYPHECCGVLLGTISTNAERTVAEVVRCDNTREDSPQNRYHISPVELVRVQRQGRERGLDIVGFYHSHPDHPARWSQTDLDEAHWIGCSYVITSVQHGRAEKTNSFLLTGSVEEDKAFVDEQLLVVEEAAELAAKKIE